MHLGNKNGIICIYFRAFSAKFGENQIVFSNYNNHEKLSRKGGFI